MDSGPSPLDDIRGERLSAFPAGLAGEGGDALLNLLSFALRTGSLGLFMLRNAQDYRKFLLTVQAFILVCRHFSPPFSGHAFIRINRLLYLNELEYIVKKGNVDRKEMLLSGEYY
jgi:hypothetical protein